MPDSDHFERGRRKGGSHLVGPDEGPMRPPIRREAENPDYLPLWIVVLCVIALAAFMGLGLWGLIRVA